eukprot:238011_1
MSDANSFNLKSTSYLPMYSPIIAGNLDMFMMNYNANQIGVYYMNPYGKNWQITLTDVGQYSSYLSGYNPKNKCFYSHTSIRYGGGGTYGFLILSQWMNGPVTEFSASSMYLTTGRKTGVVVMSSEYNMTFVTSDKLNALSTDDSFPPQTNLEWYATNTIQIGNVNSIPVLDENEGIVSIWSEVDGNIQALNITNGSLIRSYRFGNDLQFTCNWNYGRFIGSFNGCLGVQPIITQNNIFWSDGIDINIFDKNSG